MNPAKYPDFLMEYYKDVIEKPAEMAKKCVQEYGANLISVRLDGTHPVVITDSEGQSVLTAWAAGKFVGETVAKFIKDTKLEDQVKTRKIVIPGFVSQIRGDLEEHLPGWEVIVGCQEASDIPSFVKNVKLT